MEKPKNGSSGPLRGEMPEVVADSPGTSQQADCLG
jgi:hypothetical protein